jgi:alkanesulfonate monooxygenase SsuD/methylene tetrahydromethanopterin reductase-like flavin-dependent oxidoreductase (luciferase family)
VGLPNVGEFGEPPVLVDLAVAAEKAGWDGVYLWDHVLYREPTWPVANPVVVAGAIAAVTSRVRIMTAVALPRRRPWVVAREAATLDTLSGGRLAVVPVLGSTDVEFEAFGEPAALGERAARLDASLEFVAGALGGSAVSWAGGPPVRFMPARPAVPVWGTGRWPARPGLRRAARWQGVLPTFSGYGREVAVPAPMFAEAVSFVRAERGGSLDGFDVALEGATEPGASLVPGRHGPGPVAPYVEAGLTWWIEAMGWWRGGVPAARDRIAAGP